MKKGTPQLIINEITDVYARRNFQEIQKHFDTNNQLVGFKFFELVLTADDQNKKIAHGFNFAPSDIIVTQITGAGKVTFHIGSFTQTDMYVSATDNCRIRFFMGTYWNYDYKEQNAKEDLMIFSSSSANGISSETKAIGITGQIVEFAGRTLPSNAIWCDGKLYEASKYPNLAYELWDPVTQQYAYGGKGVYPNGYFNVPDKRGVVGRGVDGDAGRDVDKATRTAANAGGNTGNTRGSYQDDAVGPHSHSMTLGGWWGTNPRGTPWGWSSGNTSSGSETKTTNSTGTGISTETRMKNIYVNYFIIT